MNFEFRYRSRRCFETQKGFQLRVLIFQVHLGETVGGGVEIQNSKLRIENSIRSFAALVDAEERNQHRHQPGYVAFEEDQHLAVAGDDRPPVCV